ncbi:MAG: hypothetical protein GY765_21780, partial [bacterium]|nr:hypothetical protein [bacterium]
MLSALILPYFSSSIDRTAEKKQIMSIVTAVADVKKKAFTNMKVGVISSNGRGLVFFLDNREIGRVPVPRVRMPDGDIFFNR